jgi:hypothetical protein
MRVVLQIESGPDAPRSFVIEPGREVQVGRTSPAQVVLARDRTVSRQHFALIVAGTTCRIRDLGSTHGTALNGSPVGEARVFHGDVIAAGTTVFRVAIEGQPDRETPRALEATVPSGRRSPAPSSRVETREGPPVAAELSFHDRVIDSLRPRSGSLFAIVDAARDPMAYLRVYESREPKQSLYEGPKADQYGFVAPYLVSLSPRSRTLDALVRDGWGESWGVYLTSDRPFEEVRKHLRRFLTVKLEGGGGPVLFRFYDPRVLRVYLPSCAPDEMSGFFGPIGEFLLEGEEPDIILRYRNTGAGIELESRPIEGAAE